MASSSARRQSFKVATCNVLFEQYYVRHCKHDVMPYPNRLAAWKRFISDPTSIFAKYDLVLLQEFASGDRDWTGAFDGTPYRLLTSKQPKKSDTATKGVDSTAVVYNTNTFREVLPRDQGGVSTFSFGKGKTAIRVLLQNVRDGSLVSATSAHLPWSPPNEPEEQVKTLQILHDFAVTPTTAGGESGGENSDELLALLRSAPRSSIIGGDFNIEPFKTQLRLAKKATKSSPPPEEASASTPESTGVTTVAGSNGDLQASLMKTNTTLPVFTPEQGWSDLTAGFPWSHIGRGGPCRLDFIVAKEDNIPSGNRESSPGVVAPPKPADATDVFPPSANQLVKHDKHDVNKYGPAFDDLYFSDHAFCGVSVDFN